jgi:hypothetical protein
MKQIENKYQDGRLGRQCLTPVILATWDAEIRRIMVQGQTRANSSQYPISKITREKWTIGVARAAENLLCKLKALSLNPSPPHKKR